MAKYLSRKRFIIIAAAIAGVMVCAYMTVASLFALRFFPGTLIGGVDVSMMTLYEAESAVDKAAGIDSISVIGRDGEETMDLSEAEAKRVYPEPRDILGAQRYLAWPKYLKGTKAYGETYYVAYDEAGLNRAVSLFISEKAAFSQSPDAAYVDFDEDKDMYVIVPDTEGTRINRAVFKRALTKALTADKGSIDLSEAGAYYQAFIRADDETLSDEAAFLNAVNLKSVDIDMGASVTETIEGREILDFLNDERVPDEDKVRDYVDMLAEVYNTYDTSVKRVFTTHSGSTRSLSCYYGWQLNEERTAKALLKALEEVMPGAGGEENEAEAAVINLSASWTHTGASHDTPDYGSTYVEVDMGGQNVYVYKDGELVIDTPCVTGLYKDEKRRTPAGIWYIKSKQTNKTLTGYLPDGSIDYQSFVNYWMPFNGGIGLHDATWRGSFGGTIYMTNGSHGCINLPRQAAQELYLMSYVGMPVICYY